MTQMVISEKGLQKKKVSPPSSTKAHPLKDIQAELSQFLNYKLQIQIYNTQKRSIPLHLV